MHIRMGREILYDFVLVYINILQRKISSTGPCINKTQFYTKLQIVLLYNTSFWMRKYRFLASKYRSTVVQFLKRFQTLDFFWPSNCDIYWTCLDRTRGTVLLNLKVWHIIWMCVGTVADCVEVYWRMLKVPGGT